MDNIKLNDNLPQIFPERIERHFKSKPTLQAYLFFPKENETIDIDCKNPKNNRRRIFDINGENQFIEFEKEKLKILNEEIEKYNKSNKNVKLEFISNWKVSDTLRFLQSTSYDYSKTIQLLLEHFQWKKIYYPIQINKNIEKILESGFIYIHGRDNHFRPIIVVCAEKYMQLNKVYKFEDFMNTIIYFIEYTIQNLLIPGQVENWNIIGDLSNVSLFTLPSDLKKMFKILQSNFRARLNVIFIVGMNPILNIIWGLMKNFIDPVTHKKIRFLKENNREDLFEFINKEQVEKKYGGNAANVDEISGYFPSTMPSQNFFKNNDKIEEILISEDKYLQFFLEGKLTIVSPYFIEKMKIETESASLYEDAKSHLENCTIHHTQNDNFSVYEPCRELSANLNKSILKYVDIETENEKTPIENCNVEVIENYNIKVLYESKDNFNSNINTNYNDDDQIKVVRGGRNNHNNQNNQNNQDDYLNLEQSTPVSFERNTPNNNNQSEDSIRIEKEEFIHQSFSFNDDDTDVKKRTEFESDIKYQCCSTKSGKCNIF